MPSISLRTSSSVPVLIIHGDADKAVNIFYGRRAAEVYEHAEFVCLPGEIHGFTGSANSKWFRGEILPGAADVQRRKLWKKDRFCADYTLEGTDHTGQKCRIHIVNVDEGQGWKPTVITDSKALAFLNGADCRAVLQGHKNKLTVRIFAKPFDTKN